LKVAVIVGRRLGRWKGTRVRLADEGLRWPGTKLYLLSHPDGHGEIRINKVRKWADEDERMMLLMMMVIINS
jgi:hypothetical protein